jgi:predicted nucleic acid-binding protein
VTTPAALELAVLDTNLLVYALDQESAFHQVSRALLLKGTARDSEERFGVTPQILAEFFAVVTDPRRVRNPRTPQEALDAVERLMALPGLAVLAIPVDIVPRWVALARQYPIRGPEVFDMQLVATMLANGVRRIYTFNRGHFAHFSEIEAVTPQ